MKLVVEERESAPLRELAGRIEGLCCSLVRTELRRAAARVVTADLQVQIEHVLGRVGLLALDDALLDRAGGLSPANLRSLDAIHLAAALRVAHRISAVVTYDDRMAAAARLHGLEVWAPGSDL